MSKIPMSSMKVARVLHDDADFITLEVGKRDDVHFHLQQDETGETVGGDNFYTILFVHKDADGATVVWDPIG